MLCVLCTVRDTHTLGELNGASTELPVELLVSTLPTTLHTANSFHHRDVIQSKAIRMRTTTSPNTSDAQPDASRRRLVTRNLCGQVDTKCIPTPTVARRFLLPALPGSLLQ